MPDEKSWHGWYLFDEGARDNLYERCHELREKDPVNETPLGLWRLTRPRHPPNKKGTVPFFRKKRKTAARGYGMRSG